MSGARIVADRSEAEIVRMIFELAERGQTSSGIARVLNEKGLERRNRKPWTQRQVVAILSCQLLYADGVLRYGKVSGQNKGLSLLEERGQAG